jgi:hypothetical protein
VAPITAPNKFTSEAGVSMMRTTVLGSFNLDAQWDKEMRAFISTFIFPGFLSMSLDMGGFRKREPLGFHSHSSSVKSSFTTLIWTGGRFSNIIEYVGE